jgi:hypothetical protein
MESKNAEKADGGLKGFLIGKGAMSECPFHRMNFRVYEKIRSVFGRKEPLEEEPGEKESRRP